MNNCPSILDVLKMLGSYDKLIQVSYYPSKCGCLKEKRSGIMKVGNVTYRHIDHWTFKKHVAVIAPAIDKQGRKFLWIRLRDDEELK